MTNSLDDCDLAFQAILLRKSDTEVQAAFEMLLQEYPVLSFELGRGSIFWRGRKCGVAGFPKEADLAYPPPEFASVGRLSGSGAPCLYAATRRSTVFAELDVAVGDYVQLVGFRVLSDKAVRAISIGDLFHVYKTGYLRAFGTDPEKAISRLLNSYEHEKGLRIVYVDAFFGS